MENLGSPEPSHEPSPVSEGNGDTPPPVVDFAQELRRAQQTGDYEFVVTTAKQSHKMLVDFKAAVENATFEGRDSAHVAMGLNFVSNMIVQAANQVKLLKQTAQATRDALKTAEDQTPPESFGGH